VPSSRWQSLKIQNERTSGETWNDWLVLGRRLRHPGKPWRRPSRANWPAAQQAAIAQRPNDL
jgi:hypothetical protein